MGYGSVAQELGNFKKFRTDHTDFLFSFCHLSTAFYSDWNVLLWQKWLISAEVSRLRDAFLALAQFAPFPNNPHQKAQCLLFPLFCSHPPDTAIRPSILFLTEFFSPSNFLLHFNRLFALWFRNFVLPNCGHFYKHFTSLKSFSLILKLFSPWNKQNLQNIV